MKIESMVLNEARNIDSHRTSLDTTWFLALQATIGLDDGLTLGEAE